MKRADIEPFAIYGYTEDRTYINRYTPVMVLSTDLYMTSRYGARETVKVPSGSKMQRSQVGRNRVGMLMVSMYHTDHDSVRKLRKLATVERALDALNGRNDVTAEITDPDDPERHLGRIGVLTSLAYLHGDYHELAKALEERARRREQAAEQAEEGRLARLREHNALADRLDKLGLTGYHRAKWESPGTTVKIKAADLEELLNLAEIGSQHNTG